MKKVAFVAIALLGVATISLTNSCKKIKNAAQVSIPLSTQEIEFTLPQITSAGTINLAEVNFPLNVDSIIKANNIEFALNNIKSVTVNSCTLTMIDGDMATDDNFSALQDASIKFRSNVNTSDVNLASIANNPNVPSLTLNVPVNTTLDLATYFKTNSFSYNVSVTARKPTSKAIQCKANFSFTAKVGL